MRHDKLERELRLLLLLTENRGYTVQEICKRLELSRRNLYYYLEFFRDAGFIVEHRNHCYSIARESPFFRNLEAAVNFTEDEAIAMRQILDKTAVQGVVVDQLKRKLDKFYDLEILNNVELREQMARNVSNLYDAIKGRYVVVLKDYASAHSNTVSDRVVEPFLFMNGNGEIRCYEIASGMNKTFKLSRIGEVKMLDLTWSHESEHRQMFTDVFMFSSEKQHTVTLLLGRLSMQVLREEYPQTERYIVPNEPLAGDGNPCRWRVELPVCSYVGVGRFVLGLFEDIEVLGNEEFKEYLRNKVHLLNQKRL